MMLTPIVASSMIMLASCADAKEGKTELNAEPVAAPVSTAQVDEGPIYFDVSDDPNSPALLHLSEIEDQGNNTFLVGRTDLFNRGQPNAFGMGGVWEVDCNENRMRIIRAAQLAPNIDNPRIVDEPTVWVQPEGSIGQAMLNLVCSEEAYLDPSKVLRGDLWQYVQQFWQGH